MTTSTTPDGIGDRVTLTKVTNASITFGISGLGQEGLSPFNYSYNLDVDPAYTYELKPLGRINSWDSKGVNMYTAVRLVPYAPVSDSTGSMFGMLAISLGGLLWPRRRWDEETSVLRDRHLIQ
jgi:hypothetical protein